MVSDTGATPSTLGESSLGLRNLGLVLADAELVAVGVVRVDAEVANREPHRSLLRQQHRPSSARRRPISIQGNRTVRRQARTRRCPAGPFASRSTTAS